MRELDLYDGAPDAPSPARESPPAAACAAGAAADGKAAGSLYPDWVDLLWKRFPRAVRERYSPLGILGEGGMGVVLEAHDRQMDRVVAIKGVRDPLLIDARARTRLARESRLHARLAHPNILPIFDSWADCDGNPWCSMLRVQATAGEARAVPTLARRLEALRGLQDVDRRPLAELLETFLQICRAVAYAHSRRILHRDLKPDNILVGPSGEALVADWGLALELGDEEATAGELVGSPPYASPEQVGRMGAPISDERSDVYGLGAILFEMISGARFAGASTPGGVERRPPPALLMHRRVPRELRDIVRRATADAPAERFQDVPSLQQALQAYLAGGLVEGMSYSPLERAAKWIRARPKSSAALVTAAVFSTMLALAYWRHQQTLLADARLLRSQFAVSQQNLASSHAGWAAVEEAAGHPDEAQSYAALAFRTALEAPAGWAPPDGPVYPIFMRHAPTPPLLWACQLPGGCGALQFAPGGRSLHAVCDTEWLRLELPDTHRFQVRPLGGGRTWNMSLDPACRQLAISNATDRVSLWDFGLDQPLRSLPTEQSMAKACFSPDGRTLATGGANGAIHVWRAESGQQLGTLTGHKVDVWALGIAPGNQLLVSVDRNASMRLWDLVTLRCIREVHSPADAVLALAFSPDGRTLAASGADRSIRLYSLPQLQLAKSLGSGLPAQLSVAFSPDGRTLASGGEEGGLRLWDVSAAMEAKHPSRPEDQTWSLTLDRPGARALTVDADGTARLWDTATCRSLSTTVTDRRARTGGFSSAGHPLVACEAGEEVLVWDLADRAAPRRFAAGGKAIRTAIGAGGTLLAIARQDGRVRVCRLEAPGAPIDLRGGSAPVFAMAFAQDGQLLAGGDAKGEVAIWESVAGRQVARGRGSGGAINDLAFDRAGCLLASADDDGQVWIWEAPGWHGRRIAGHQAPVLSVALHPKGDLLVSGAGEAMYVWRVPSGKRVPHVELTARTAGRLAFGADGSLLAIGSSGAPEFWELGALENPRERLERIEAASFFRFSDSIGRLCPKDPRDAPQPRRPR